MLPLEGTLLEKLRKIEALFAGASTAGKRLAAEAALERVRAQDVVMVEEGDELPLCRR